MFILTYMRLLRDPGTGEGGGEPGTSAEAQALEQALIEQDGGNAQDKKTDGVDKGTASGSEGKQAGGDKSNQVDDPEHEIDEKDEKGQVTKKKVKLSELKAGYLRQDDYTKKTQRVAEVEKNQGDLIRTAEAIRQHPKLAKIFVSLVQNAISEKGYNEDFINKQLQVLEGVTVEPGDTKKDVEEKQEDIEALLEGVDQDSPIAKALKQTFKANKDMMAKIKGLEDGQGKVTKALTDKDTKEQEAQYNALVESASKSMESKMTEMLDPAKGNLTFLTPGEAKEWRWKVVAFLRDNPYEYKNQEDFLTRIQDVGVAVHKAMVAYREEIIAQQLEANKTPKKETESKDKPNPQAEDLEAELVRELEAISGNKPSGG